MSIRRQVAAPVAPPVYAPGSAGSPWEPGGDLIGLRLSLASGGTFARASAAYYYTQAPTDGTSAFLAPASSGARRSADTRGDGIGASLLMEKSATNYMLRSRELTDVAWTNTIDITANQNGGPLADGGADWINHASAAYGPRPTAASPGPAGAVMMSAFSRARTGTSGHQIYLYHQNGGVSLAAVQRTATTTYVRSECGGVATTNSGGFASDGRSAATLGVGSASAHTEDIYVDLVQLEAGYYPTSPIVTTSASVTRSADTLSYASGAYPVGFLTSGVAIVFAPDASSAEIVSASEDWRLLQVGANDYVRVRATAGVCKAELVCGGSVVASLTITFSRAQALTITAKPSAGSITVSGATTGNGTNTGSGAAWASSATLYIGGDNAGANNVTGRFVGAQIAQAA